MPIRYEPRKFITFQAEMGTFEHVFVTPTEYVVDVPIWEPDEPATIIIKEEIWERPWDPLKS